MVLQPSGTQEKKSPPSMNEPGSELPESTGPVVAPLVLAALSPVEVVPSVEPVLSAVPPVVVMGELAPPAATRRRLDRMFLLDTAEDSCLKSIAWNQRTTHAWVSGS